MRRRQTRISAFFGAPRLSRASRWFLWLSAVGLVSLTATAGCVAVQPYERERLARPDMELGRREEVVAGEEHATAYREGSTGAMGTSGGGCGCN